MTLPTSRLLPLRLLSLLLLLGSTATIFADREESIARYCQRVGELAAGEAEAWFELGRWCLANDLPEKAPAAFERAVALDADHAGARQALGQVRRGIEWVDPKAPDPKASGGSASRPTTAEGPIVVKVALPDREEASDPEMAAEALKRPATDGKADEDPVALKRAWAAEAAEVFQAEFQTLETEDWLIHTTLGRRSPRLRELAESLKETKRTLGTLLGVRSKLWPEKVQLFLLRSPEELDRFAEIVDQKTDLRDGDAAYVAAHGHLALWKPDGLLASQLTERAFDALHGSDRHVAWWIREGTAEWVGVRGPGEKAEGYKKYERSLRLAASYLEARGDRVSIYTLLETPSYGRGERQNLRALAMSLVDFILSSKSTGYRRLLKRLKSDEAPPPPPEEDEDAEKAFWLEYIAWQEEALESSVGKIDKLERAWKTSLLKRARSAKR